MGKHMNCIEINGIDSGRRLKGWLQSPLMAAKPFTGLNADFRVEFDEGVRYLHDGMLVRY